MAKRVTRLSRLFIGLLSLVGLSACVWQVGVQINLGNDTYQDLRGSTVVLHQTLPVRAEHARVFIQQGQVLASGAVNEFIPQCHFEIRSVDHQGTQIAPGRFTIVRVDTLLEAVVAQRFIQVAALDGWPWWRERDRSEAFEGYRFTLESHEQTEVMRMSCHGARGAAWERRPPTLQEIDAVLGQLASLERPRVKNP